MQEYLLHGPTREPGRADGMVRRELPATVASSMLTRRSAVSSNGTCAEALGPSSQPWLSSHSDTGRASLNVHGAIIRNASFIQFSS